MTAPNIAAITASLQRSLQTFSLNHHTTTTTTTTAGEDSPTTHSVNSSDATLELNSTTTPLPYHWEQCLDLKTGEMYYINWRTGMKTKEDPRTVDDNYNGYFYSDYDDEDESSYDDSESSSVESSPAGSSSEKQKENDDEGDSRVGGGQVLVVAGCKGCFMYFMVPKQVEDCPKCCGQLLHFDRSDDN
ncbi:protein CURLY FLAG LEAF 1-like [Bidens hawaiensis]|uniref:protein CURLY FLAG LEAF 1-like n=1 Tax=Bidens hawaiensis TaxID=980011 RepID=UPI00404B01F6